MRSLSQLQDPQLGRNANSRPMSKQRWPSSSQLRHQPSVLTATSGAPSRDTMHPRPPHIAKAVLVRELEGKHHGINDDQQDHAHVPAESPRPIWIHHTIHELP